LYAIACLAWLLSAAPACVNVAAAHAWPRCDAECSPSRGFDHHPSRHSAGRPIVAGWAFQRIAQVGVDRDS
jgi:hypothetical protein